MKPDGGPAYPCDINLSQSEGWATTSGMSLRDYFAGQAVIGLLMQDGYRHMGAAEQARAAYAVANAMIAARDK